MNYEIEHDACGIGTVVQIDGKQSYDVLDKALHIVEKLEHRAGKDASGKVGDGVGILLQISDDFFRNTLKKDNIKLPEHYGVGMFFLPRNKLLLNQQKKCLKNLSNKKDAHSSLGEKFHVMIPSSAKKPKIVCLAFTKPLSKAIQI